MLSKINLPNRIGGHLGRRFYSIIRTLSDEVFEPLLDFTLPRFKYLGATPLDLYEKDGKYIIELVAPGFEPRELNVEVRGNTVSLSCIRNERSDTKDVHYHRREIRSGSFSRTVTLPQDLDANAVKASIDKGILKVELTPIKAPHTPKRIEVRES